MSLQYVGRAPDSDFSVVPKSYVDARYNTIKVDNAYINTSVTAQSSGLVTQSYVDTQDGLRATKTNVDSQDALYAPTSSVGAANGLVPLDNNAYVLSANLPTLVTNRKPVYVPATSITLSGSRDVITTNAREYQAASLSIPDPGYPYIPLLFAQIQGGAVNTAPSGIGLGTASYGQVSILRSDNVKYGWCLCTSSNMLNFHTAIPFGDSTINPTTMPPIQGASTFGLWLALWSGTNYTFTSTDLNFHALVYPGF